MLSPRGLRTTLDFHFFSSVVGATYFQSLRPGKRTTRAHDDLVQVFPSEATSYLALGTLSKSISVKLRCFTVGRKYTTRRPASVWTRLRYLSTSSNDRCPCSCVFHDRGYLGT